MKLRVQLAQSSEEVLRCQYLIAEIYNRQYGVVFSRDRFDLDAKVEPWPHRYLMVLAEEELVATAGLYMRDTYVQRFGQVRREEFVQLLAEAGAAEHYEPMRLREITKLVVSNRYRGNRLSPFVLGCAHSRAFSQSEGEAPHLMVYCAKESITRNLHQRAGVRTRLIRPFPHYRIHELYRSESDPMNSRLIIPELDVPKRWLELELPGEYDTEAMLEGLAPRSERGLAPWESAGESGRVPVTVLAARPAEELEQQ